MIDLQKLLSEKREILQNLQKKLTFTGYFRVLIFAALSYFFLRYFIFESGLKNDLYLAVVLTILFLILGLFLTNIKQKIQFFKNYLHIGEEIITKTEFETGLYSEAILDEHAFAKDLDILGKNSLFSYLNYAETSLGKNHLKDFLLNLTIKKSEIILRQKSIAELAKKTSWNIHFLTLAKAMQIKGKIVHPARSKSHFENALLAKIATVAVPVFTLSTLFLILFSSVSGTWIGLMFLGIFIISRIVLFIYREKMQQLGEKLSFDSNQYEQFLNVFSIIEKENFTEELNISLQKKLKSGKSQSSQKEITKLARLLRNYESGQSNIGVILNNFFLWNLYFTMKIEKQFNAIDTDLPQWFEAFSAFEALISLGIFTFNNPEYIFPEIIEKGEKLNTEKLIHPLLFKKEVVSNDFAIDENTEISIITGANMTGKSTFLRAVGTNLVLAMAGCPVAAKKFSFIPMKVFTSIRTSDSLNDGTSYFNAEILRLRKLIENLKKGEPQFIILDEILKGTNSKDKLIGSELFLEKLMKTNTLFSCLIATHDLDLTKIEANFPLKIKNYCFELQNIDGELETDYHLQNGVTKSMNAIYLMKKFGIIDA